MIIDLCIKYESNTLIFSEEMETIFSTYRQDNEVEKEPQLP